MKPSTYLHELFSTLFPHSQLDRDLDEEFLAHIQRHANDLELVRSLVAERFVLEGSAAVGGKVHGFTRSEERPRD